MSNQTGTNTTIDWEKVILDLQTFTRSWVNGKGWFRGGKTKTFLKGKEIDDYVYGAIEKYLLHPEKYDPSQGSLVDYLNYNIIRTLVRNDLVSSENRTSQDVFAFAEERAENNETDTGSYLDRILPFAGAYFDQEIDYNTIMSAIETEISGDSLLEEIFLGVCSYGLKRREVIEEFKLTPTQYDNGIRRLKTILHNTAVKYDLKIQLS